jgi:hypothetical protein
MIWLGMAWKFLRGLPWQVYAAAGLCVLVLGLRWHWIGVGEDRVQAAWDAQEAVYAQERADAIIAARKVEERHRAEYRAIADRFLAIQEKADEEHAATVAALRSGALRVRERFTCPAPAGMPGAAADSPGAADSGPRGFQPEDAAAAIGIAEEADRRARQLNALIEAVKAGQR